MHAYLTHPQVKIDPAVPVPRWGLSEKGRARSEALARSDWPRRFRRIVASDETKAIETAEIIAGALGLAVETREAMHENDRSATGFLPPDEFEKVADAFFAHPHESVRGWERAIDAQARIVSGVVAALAEAPQAPTLFVGHGGVGTLLLCHLAGRPIQRVDALRTNRFKAGDQPPGGGNAFAFTLTPPEALSGWRSIEEMAG